MRKGRIDLRPFLRINGFIATKMMSYILA